MNGSGRNRRDVWTIPTSPYKGAHFATFPPKLVEPCVLAGTSAKGVCPECGAPWERMVKKSGGTTGKGWRPACDHGGEPVPAVVLDPFCGSGTVGAVCNTHGRKFVGLDMSRPYLELAKDRISKAPIGMGI